MSLNDSINLLEERGRISKRGLVRPKPEADKTIQKFYPDISNQSQNSILLDTIQYVPNNVYFAERTFAPIGTELANTSSYVKSDANLLKEKSNLLYEHFLEVAQSRNTGTEIFETIEDFIQVCTDTFNEILKNGGRLNERNQFDGFGWLNQERNTWKLLHCLYKDRILVARHADGDSELDEPMLHSSEKEIIEKLYEQNENLREYQLIVDWLEQCSLQQHFDRCRHFMDETISWENTLHQLQNVDRTVFGSAKPIVKSLDPDAPYRENLPLHDLDMEDEMRISMEILGEIRQGRLDEAGALCERVGQYWRAAVLEGWRLHHDPNYKNLGVVSEKYPIEGNPRRDLWKKLAWQMAENKKVNEYTRAYIGVFCGHLEAMLGPLSNSWADLLWAYLKVQIDICVEEELRSSSTKSYVDLPKKYWDSKMTLEQIFEELEAHKNLGVKESAKHQMTIIRKYIILDDIPELMRNFDTWLADIKDNGQMLRFITHIVLFMRQTGRQHQEPIANRVIKTYTEFLIKDGAEPSLVAFYTATLPAQQQVPLYAKLLENIQDSSLRKLTLDEAQLNGLDVNAITTHAVHAICLKQESESVGKQLIGSISALDNEKISSLEWLTFNAEQSGELLWHLNALVRTLLAENKIECIRKALKMVPQETVQRIYTHFGSKDNLPARIECSIKEYHCHLTYLSAIDSNSDWLHLYHSKPKAPELVRSDAHFTERMASEHKEQAYLAELERWKMNLLEQTRVTRDIMYQVLKFSDKGYLVDPDTFNPILNEDKEAMQNRHNQLENLRKLCIPDIVLLLHNILHSASDYKGCVSLADDLVSENWQLYTIYTKHKLTEIIGKIAESSLALMNEKLDPWGYSIAT